MDKSIEIKRALQETLGIKPNLPMTATVLAVDNDTCTVQLLSGFELSDVRLKATITDEKDTFLITPKINSDVVLMSQTGELSGLIVIKVDAVEKIEFKKGGLEFVVDGTTGKVTLKKGAVNLGGLMSELITNIKKLVIMTPSGPGNVAPSSITKLSQLETKFKQILNTN